MLSERAALQLCRISLGDRVFEWAPALNREKRDWRRYLERLRADPNAEIELINVVSRDPPLPRWERVHANQCPVCGQPTYAGGAWWPEAGKPRHNKMWHSCCAQAFGIWKRPADAALFIAERQDGKCPESGDAIIRERTHAPDWRSAEPYVQRYHVAEVDHRTPLWRVRYEAHLHAWPGVLTFWGLGNLQALSRRGHAGKTAREALERAQWIRSNLSPRSTLAVAPA